MEACGMPVPQAHPLGRRPGHRAVCPLTLHLVWGGNSSRVLAGPGRRRPLPSRGRGRPGGGPSEVLVPSTGPALAQEVASISVKLANLSFYPGILPQNSAALTGASISGPLPPALPREARQHPLSLPPASLGGPLLGSLHPTLLRQSVPRSLGPGC